MYVCRETGVCLERLECFGRRVACAYVYEEREMCLWQERKSCMGVCLYRKGAEVFGGKDGFFIPLFMWKDWAVCLCLLVYNVCVCRNRDYKESAPKIIEAHKCPNLHLTSWTPKKANGVVLV